MNSNHRLTATTWISGMIFVGYLLWGYATFLDGNVFRQIITFYKPDTLLSSERLTCDVTHQTTKKIYQLGEIVTAEMNVVKHRAIEGIVQWNLMDARFYGYAPRRGIIPPGSHHLVVDIERLPKHIPPGKYYFKGLVKYETNLIKDIYVPIQTNEFEVVK